MSDTPTCTHDAPKTHYTRSSGQQIASNTISSGGMNSSSAVWVEILGPLCDQCARDAGLQPVAFGRPLDIS